MNDTSQPIKDWIPYKLKYTSNSLLFQWLYLDSKRFIEPFFEESLAKCKSLKENSKHFRTASDQNSFFFKAGEITPTPVKAIIFHVSRCGSTLLSQLLGLNPAWISLAEVPLFDDVLRLNYKHVDNGSDSKRLLKSSIDLVGKKRFDEEEYLFIKTDSWHIFFYEMYRSLYPNVPFILLYRKPDEVIRSHQKKRGMQAVPGVIEPEVFGFTKDEIAVTDLDAYITQVLIKYQQKYLDIAIADPLVHLVNYNEGPLTMIQKIAEATQLTLEDDYLQKVIERSGFHSKYPDKLFAEKQDSELTIPGLADAMKLYNKLEQLRNQ